MNICIYYIMIYYDDVLLIYIYIITMMISQSLTGSLDHRIIAACRGSLSFCIRKQLGGPDGPDGRDDSGNPWWSGFSTGGQEYGKIQVIVPS